MLKKNPEARNERDLNQLMPFIKENQFFRQRQIHHKHLTEVCSELRHEFIRAREFVFHEGDYGDKFYILLKGRVQVLCVKEDFVQ